jgi:hypothetical protein
MLRLGHLTVLCEAAIEAGGAAHRFNRDAAERLTRLVVVPELALPGVATYLHAKKLCPEKAERTSADFDGEKFRYPDIVLTSKNDEDVVESWPARENPVSISWQDLCLSADGVQSRVGSVSIHGRYGSKTGLSHIIDWSTMLDLTNASGAPFAHGQLVAKFASPTRPRSKNPYLLGNEKLVFAERMIRSDFDVFAALISSLSDKKEPLRKKEATQEYIQAVQAIGDTAEGARYLSQRERQNLFSLWRDLRRSGRSDTLITSTAWHRAASRFEMYVDLGLLRKGVHGEHERYEYKYYVTDTLRGVSETLNASRGADHWLNEHLVDTILGINCSRETIPPGELLELMPRITAPLARPTSPLPIDTLAIGLVWLAADMERPLTLGAARRSIEDLATKRPDIARLSTGSSSRPEYISIHAGGTHHGHDAGSKRI